MESTEKGAVEEEPCEEAEEGACEREVEEEVVPGVGKRRSAMISGVVWMRAMEGTFERRE